MQKRKQQNHAFLYTLPALVLTITFFLIPLVYLISVSLFKWNGLGPWSLWGLAITIISLITAIFTKPFA